MITSIRSRAPGRTMARTLLVMLPGAGSEATEFAERGMVAAVRRRGLPVDIVAAQPALELYLDGSVAHALHRGIVEPALAEGYARLWLLGISLGGMAGLLYVSHHAALAEGLVLLAPFLGTQGTIAAIAAAGGFAARSAPDAAITATERRIVAWLQDFLTRRPLAPRLYLGYGQADRFARGHRMLADRLPADRVVAEEGAHDWDTWLTLWDGVLDLAPFPASSGDKP